MSDDASEVWPLIWKELYGRYKELVEVNERYATHVRCAVAGADDSAPLAVYRALFGDPVAVTDHATPAAGTWQVAAGFSLDEVPGLGVVGGTGSEERALAYLREADVVVLTSRMGRRPTDLERGLHSHAKRLSKAFILVVTGADDGPQPPDEESEEWRVWALELSRLYGQSDLVALPLRGHTARHLVAIAGQLHEKLDKRFRLSFCARVKHVASRDSLVGKMIHELARVAAFLGLNPIPFSDVVAITPVQVLLVCRVAAAFGVKVSVSWAREFLLACGVVTVAGLGFRQLFRVILGQLGTPALPVRMLLGGGVAWFGTEVIGHAARIYFASEGRLTVSEAAEQAREMVCAWAESGELAEAAGEPEPPSDDGR